MEFVSKWSLLEYDPNSNMTLVGTLGGLMVRVTLISGFVDRISSAVLRGVSHEGRLIGRDTCNREQEGSRDTRVRQVQAVSMT